LPKVISIVDDDESFRHALTDLVRSLGHAVASFASAEEFLNSDRVNDTACLITDVKMPGMSGFELQSALLARAARMPVIFVAADSRARARRQALASGALAYLVKPFREERLVRLLGQALGDHRVSPDASPS